MPGAAIKNGNEEGLRKVFAVVASAMAETLRPLVNKELAIQPGEISLCPVEVLLGSLGAAIAVGRGEFAAPDAGRLLRFAFCVPDAVALSGSLASAPKDAIEARRKQGTLEGEDLAAFTELGNALCSGVESALRSVVGPGFGLHRQDHGIVESGLDPAGVLGDQPLVVLSCILKFAAYPPTTCYVLAERDTATKWSGKALEFQDIAGTSSGDAKPSSTDSGRATGNPAHLNTAEKRTAAQAAEELEAIPAAPVRGKLSAFLVDNEVVLTVRKTCRRIGLDLDRRGRTDIPNPAAHRDQLVIIEVAAGEERRFEWCKRLKAFHEGIKVVLLLHHPTRQRVLQGFMAKADALLGIPVQESLLSAKLAPILEAMLKAKEESASTPEPQKSS